MRGALDLDLGPVGGVEEYICAGANLFPMASACVQVPSPAPGLCTTEWHGGEILGKVLHVYLWVFVPCDNVPKFIFAVVWRPHLVFS